jgi:hypothetical protein
VVELLVVEELEEEVVDEEVVTLLDEDEACAVDVLELEEVLLVEVVTVTWLAHVKLAVAKIKGP